MPAIRVFKRGVERKEAKRGSFAERPFRCTEGSEAKVL